MRPRTSSAGTEWMRKMLPRMLSSNTTRKEKSLKAENTARTQSKTCHSLLVEHSHEQEEGAEEELTRAEERRQLTAAVMALPEKYRTVIHLFYYEDYSGAEIAEMLGLSEANVRKQLSRAREMLKEKLKEDWNYD